MVIDSSAALAVLLDETDASSCANAIEEASDPAMSAVSALEIHLVIGARKHAEGVEILSRFLEVSGIRIVSFDAE